jgi:hypothetical protein
MPSNKTRNFIKLLCLPSRHPYTSKLESNFIKIINPETDYFNEAKRKKINIVKLISEKHIPSEYDIVHIHFSFNRISPESFFQLLNYFKDRKKKIIWTSHSKESQHDKNLEDGLYEKYIYKFSDLIISPTLGCKKWIENNIGKDKSKDIVVIPLGYMAPPDKIDEQKTKITRENNSLIYLIGEFRENKEWLESILNILQCNSLKNYKLNLLYKPLEIYSDKEKKIIDERKKWFWQITHNSPRINNICLDELSNDLLIRNFLSASFCILPYKWGTHSGQIELARDCGCKCVASNVGFYKDQWKEVVLYGNGIEKKPEASTLTEAIIYSSKLKQPKIDTQFRRKEHQSVFVLYLDVPFF